jgi:hypothetical protein
MAQDGREPYSEFLLIELSPLVPEEIASNPTPGIFARVSAGGRLGADYYWLPVTKTSGESTIGRPVRLMVDDG